jgi:hypothetical protein
LRHLLAPFLLSLIKKGGRKQKEKGRDRRRRHEGVGRSLYVQVQWQVSVPGLWLYLQITSSQEYRQG